MQASTMIEQVWCAGCECHNDMELQQAAPGLAAGDSARWGFYPVLHMQYCRLKQEGAVVSPR